MRSLAVGCVVVIIAVVVSGCTTSEVIRDASRSEFQQLQEMADTIATAGGVAVVSKASSLTEKMAQEKAINRGRLELATKVESHIGSLKKAFAKESDAGEEEIEALFSAAEAHLVSQIKRSAMPVESVQQTSDGMTTISMLFEADPGLVPAALAEQANVDRGLHARLVASEAFAALQARVESYQRIRASRGN